ncbi:hypothetical protein AGDE_10940 [Angomonas deanei]|nr:hypothetical protein AGDE_10940 [Angomonas deanei]|eukprot:EPY27089.1 hypothetical protein AGDE_10940 [Angomonas deanei]
MLWCRQTFEKEFADVNVKIFALQKDMFDFIDARPSKSREERWLPFSVEFPSEADVSEILATRALKKSEGSFIKAEGNVRKHFSLLYGENKMSQQTRLFLAGTPGAVRKMVEVIPSEQLHLYEVIRENCGCHLFFDLEREMDRSALCTVEDLDAGTTSTLLRCTLENGGDGSTAFTSSVERYTVKLPSVHYDSRLQCPLTCPVVADNDFTSTVLLAELRGYLEKFSKNTITIDEVILLESVPLSPKPAGEFKFSQHYIIKFANHVFRSTKDAGVFVLEFVQHLRRRSSENSVHSSLFFHGPPMWAEPSTPGGENTLPVFKKNCVIDTAVYSRNRSMRTVGSCKLGKDAVLRVASWTRNGKPFDYEHRGLSDNFFATLITDTTSTKDKIELEAASRVFWISVRFKAAGRVGTTACELQGG